MRLSKAKKNELLSKLRENAVGQWDAEVGRFYLVLYFLEGATGRTEPCPYCGKNHQHGQGEGHRLPHCSWDIFNKELRDRTLSFQNARGQTFTFDDGYYILRKNYEINY